MAPSNLRQTISKKKIYKIIFFQDGTWRQVATSRCRWLQSVAGTCSHLQPLTCPSSHLQPLGSHLAATCSGSHLQPLGSHWQPFADTCPKWLPQMAAKWLPEQVAAKWLTFRNQNGACLLALLRLWSCAISCGLNRAASKPAVLFFLLRSCAFWCARPRRKAREKTQLPCGWERAWGCQAQSKVVVLLFAF